MIELGLQPASVMIEHLDSAVAEVFALMLGTSCLPTERPPQIAPGITVAIRLSGPLQGSCRLHLAYPAATAATRAMIGAPGEALESMLEDAAGELCNMIVGSWKSRLTPLQASALLSLPVTTHGEKWVPAQSLHYRFEGNLLALALSVREQIYLTTD